MAAMELESFMKWRLVIDTVDPKRSNNAKEEPMFLVIIECPPTYESFQYDIVNPALWSFVDLVNVIILFSMHKTLFLRPMILQHV